MLNQARQESNKPPPQQKTTGIQQQSLFKKVLKPFGWEIPEYYTGSEIYKDFTKSKIRIIISKPAIVGDRYSYLVILENSTNRTLKANISMTTASSESKIAKYDRTAGLVIFPQKSNECKLTVSIPQSSKSNTERIILVECHITSPTDSLMLTKEFSAD